MSLEELRELANHKQSLGDSIRESNLENMDEEIFSVENIDESE